MTLAFVHGFILALGLILPLGVQNVFVFNQGATQAKFIHAVPVILAAGICDTLLILAAVGGVSVVVLSAAWIKMALIISGVCFLLYMGWLTWKSSGADMSGKMAAMTRKQQILFAVSVSLLNPHAILDTVGVIGTSSLAYTGSEKVAFTVSCVTVSWLWFTFLVVAGRIVGSLDNSGRIIGFVNKLSAIVMWLSAGYLVYSLA